MTYTSAQFILFVAAARALYQFCPARARAAFLLAASYVFYFTWSIPAAGLLAGATILTFFAARRAADASRPRRAGVAAAASTILLAANLVFFKFASAPLAGAHRILLPLGLSYYTFKLISYVMDVYWAKIQPSKDFVPFAAYVAFFPQILAGPIQRPGDFLEQTAKRATIGDGIERIAVGLAKKLLVADLMAPAVSYVFSNLPSLSGAQLLAGFYLFPLQLYADFSGLTDIAIGTGLLFGIAAPENFNRPFTASSLTDFWRRWHMSLTNWLVDYVFTPLRMATRWAGSAGLAFSITVNMTAIGLWHGIAWGFLMFGLLHAAYLTVEALTSRSRKRFFSAHPALDGLATRLGPIYVFQLVSLALVFFRAPSVRGAIAGLSHLTSVQTTWLQDLRSLGDMVGMRTLLMGVAGYVLIEIGERWPPNRWLPRLVSGFPEWVRVPARAAALTWIALAAFSLLSGGVHSDKPFIYEKF